MKKRSRRSRTILEYVEARGELEDCQPNRVGYEKAILNPELPEGEEDIPSSCAEGLKKADANVWLKACKFEINYLNKLDS